MRSSGAAARAEPLRGPGAGSRGRHAAQERAQRHAQRIGRDLVDAREGEVVEEPDRGPGAHPPLQQPEAVAGPPRALAASAGVQEARMGGGKACGQRPAGGPRVEGADLPVGDDGDSAAEATGDEPRRGRRVRVGERRLGGGQSQLGAQAVEVPRLVAQVGGQGIGQLADGAGAGQDRERRVGRLEARAGGHPRQHDADRAQLGRLAASPAGRRAADHRAASRPRPAARPRRAAGGAARPPCCAARRAPRGRGPRSTPRRASPQGRRPATGR